jgi:putative membrane protein
MAESERTGKPSRQVTEALTQSARELKHSAAALEEETDQRVALAQDRTFLAAERTYAAWVRTGLAALASGIGARAVLKDAMPLLLVQLTASVLIVFAAFCLCAAIWREFYSVPEGRTRVSVVPRALLIPLNGLLVLVTLAALVGVWLE